MGIAVSLALKQRLRYLGNGLVFGMLLFTDTLLITFDSCQ